MEHVHIHNCISWQEAHMEEKEPSVSNSKTNWGKEIISWIVVIAAGFLLAFFVTRVLIIKAVVPTSSMETTIMVDDKIIGNRLSYLFSDPKRGDIVIFEYPVDPTEDYVKRIIGLPGETISFADGKVFIDGKELKEDYVNGALTIPGNEDSYTIPEGCYFMMGDNRTYSLDARFWSEHFVKKDAIKGKVLIRYSPSWGRIK